MTLIDLHPVEEDDDDVFTIYGPWRRVGEEAVLYVDVPTVVKGFSSTPMQTVRTPIYRTVERRAVWKLVGYEERTRES